MARFQVQLEVNRSFLSKVTLKKLAPLMFAFAALWYGYSTYLLNPLVKSSTDANEEIARLDGKIANGRRLISTTVNLERTGETAVTRSGQIEALIPNVAPIAWLPPRIRAAFTAPDMAEPRIRALRTVPYPEPALGAFAKSDWLIEISNADFIAFVKLLARLENDDPLLSITRIQIRTSDEPAVQQMVLAAARIVKQ